MDKDLRKSASDFYDEHLAKMASVGHGGLSAPTELTGGATGAFGLKPALKNEDLEPNQQHDVKRLSSINKLFGKESPREVASIAVTDGDRILMGQRKDSGRWTMPGGHIEDGENRRDGALRELKEEAGIEGQPITYMGSVHIPDRNLIVHTYKCNIFGGCDTNPHGDPDEEVDQWHWIDAENGLPDEILGNLHNKKDAVLNMLGLQGWGIEKSEVHERLKNLRDKLR